jgi:hypothetical protein
LTGRYPHIPTGVRRQPKPALPQPICDSFFFEQVT